MLPDSVSWGRGERAPLVVFRPDTAGGHFEGVLGTSSIVGDRLAIDGFTAEQARFIEAAIQQQSTDTEVVGLIVSSRLKVCAGVAGRYVLHDSPAAILNGKLRATGLSGTEIVEVND